MQGEPSRAGWWWEGPPQPPPVLSASEFLSGLYLRAVANAEPCPFTGLPQDRPVERVRG